MGKGRKPNAKGRNDGESFVKLPRWQVRSPAWLDLSPSARCIYVEMRARYNGSNNGEISFSCREAARFYKGSKSTAKRCFDELVSHGFVRMNNRGHYGNKHASTWVLTDDPFNGQRPTRDWNDWISPATKKAVPDVGQIVPVEERIDTNCSDAVSSEVLN